MTNWSGVFPAVTTKMSANGVIDIGAMQKSVERLVDSGVNGVVMLPMLGENASLNDAERERVLRAAAEVVAGRVPMLSGLAAITTERAQSLAKSMKQ